MGCMVQELKKEIRNIVIKFFQYIKFIETKNCSYVGDSQIKSWT